MAYAWGLDLGTTSIGWAVVELDEEQKARRLEDANSRIFLSMVEAKTKLPKNQNRRAKRLMRRQVARYKGRREALLALLHEHQFFAGLTTPQLCAQDWEKVLNELGNPFLLRTNALEEKLSLAQLGRVFIHLLRRRGYKSNRGIKFAALLKYVKECGFNPQFDDRDQAEGEDEKKEKGSIDETGKVLHGIELLQAALKNTMWKGGESCKTVAQLMVKLRAQNQRAQPLRPYTHTKIEQNKKGKEQVYHLYTTREMLEQEFALIWDKQKEFYPQVLSEGLKASIFHAIFQQRNPLEHLARRNVGRCSLELNRSRAARALLEAQEFLMLESLNHLKYSMPRRSRELELTDEQRHAILQALNDPSKLNAKGQLSWAEVKKVAQLDKGVKFNLEASSKNGLSGNQTQLAMLRTIPGHWQKLAGPAQAGETFSALQKQLVTDLLFIDDKVALFKRLTNHYQLPPQRNPWHFSAAQAFQLITMQLPEGYVKHCLHVIKRLLPALRRGLRYDLAVQEGGFLRRDQMQVKAADKLGPAPELANPIVQKALYEIRRVVNALLQKYGRPAFIRLEMARDIKASKAHRKEIEARQKKQQKSNQEAADAIRDFAARNPDLGLRVTEENITRYKLWLEQGKNCAYSWSEQSHDRHISQAQLFTAAVEIDHIYPRSQSLDNSYLNKVLCFRMENQDKGQRTPFQAWGQTEKYKAILRRFDRNLLSSYPAEKLRRLKDDQYNPGADFAAAQLNDTRYICVAVRNYLAQLGFDDQHLQVSRGQMTAELRKLWGLKNVLPRIAEELVKNEATASGQEQESDDEEEGGTDAKSKEGKKKDRRDHRHHAVDAIVTALVDLKVYKNLQERYRYFEEHGRWPQDNFPCPIPDLRQQAQNILHKNVVSHSCNRKVRGGLHNELPFGLGTYLERGMSIKKLLAEPAIILAEPGDELSQTAWIADPDLRTVLRGWLQAYLATEQGKRKRFPPPILPDGRVLETVDVTRRCFVKRDSVEKALRLLANNPGKNTWIVDQGTRQILQEWKNTHALQELATDPPRMRRKDGQREKAAPILSVRLACLASGMVRFKDRPQVFAKESNHHVVIFKKLEANGKVQRKGVFVDMLEAARRARELPIIRKDPAQLLQQEPELDLTGWEFEMALCSQDMVWWDVEADKEYDAAHQTLGPPIYRLQKMSGANNSLVFRHYSVTASADGDSYGVLRRRPNTLCARKIHISSLGEWEFVEK